MTIIKSLRIEDVNGEECHILIKKNDIGDALSLSLEVYYYNRYTHEWLPYSTLGIKLPGGKELNKFSRGDRHAA